MNLKVVAVLRRIPAEVFSLNEGLPYLVDLKKNINHWVNSASVAVTVTDVALHIVALVFTAISTYV